MVEARPIMSHFRFSNVIEVDNPSVELCKWCDKNLTFANPEYAKMSRMNLPTKGVFKVISLFETRGKTLILPYGVLSLMPPRLYINGTSEEMFKDVPKIAYTSEISLREYQLKAVQGMILAEGGILQAPAGSGKTRCGIALFMKLKARTLWLCHTKDLINQAKEVASEFVDPSLIGTITEGKVNIGEGVTFATVQTMCQIDLSLYKDYWECVIVDEAHRISGSPTVLTQYRKVLNNLSARYKYGLSATVHRADGMEKCMFSLIGDVAYKVSDESVAENIMTIGIATIYTGTRISHRAQNTDGTINYTRLISSLADDVNRNNIIRDTLIINKDHSSIILSERLTQLDAIMSELPKEMRDKAVLIHGKMTSKKGKEERARAIDDMRTGKKKYLFATYQLAKEGLDIPCLERLYMASPVKDYAVVTQSIGRIARVHGGKADPICFDFVDAIKWCEKAYKRRCTTYRKNRCYFIKEK